ncbi:MAG: Lon protease family protein [Candidatus Thorarchaeota archaeon]|nr:Lon protease family protein [Candidatus Thorarchaeota archaeon]
MKLDDLAWILEGRESTAEICTTNDPFQRIIGQDHAVTLVRSAITQRRHVLLCGEPGIGKSMLASAAFSLLPEPETEIVILPNLEQDSRPKVLVRRTEKNDIPNPYALNTIDEYVRPDDLPFDIAVRMGYRCPICNSLSLPSQELCIECDSPKRSDRSYESYQQYKSYSGLLRVFNIASEAALLEDWYIEDLDGHPFKVTYRREGLDNIRVLRTPLDHNEAEALTHSHSSMNVLVSYDSSRFVRVSGTSSTELLGDVRHDPYGGADDIGIAPHMRVIPGAIHEAHEGILYVDEIAALGILQKYLLTAMQERKYPISGHNPTSSGAAIRVDDVPCDFLLFASCNMEDLKFILPPLRSRIRGYGYEIMLNHWMPKTPQNANNLVRFIAQTVIEDRRIPHLSSEAVLSVLEIAKDIARRIDGQHNAFTLRLRELGGIIRISGDLAVQDGHNLVENSHVKKAEALSQGLTLLESRHPRNTNPNKEHSRYEDYFF